VKSIFGDVVSLSQNADGTIEYSIDNEVMGKVYARIAVHSKYYPPEFEGNAQEVEIRAELKNLLNTLDVINKYDTSNLVLLGWVGMLHSLGYNLDLPGSGEKATIAFTELLKLDPDNPEGNYRYGLFLSQTSNGQAESIGYLSSALDLGVKEAKFDLGRTHMQLGNNDLSIQYLKEYAIEEPESPAGQMVKEYQEGPLVVASAGFQFQSDRDWWEFLEGYYLNPQPDLIGPAMDFAGENRLFESGNPEAPVLGFFAEVFSHNPARLRDWEIVVDRQLVDARLIFKRALAAVQNPMELIENEPFLTKRNDFCWGAFYGSGDTEYLSVLLKHLSYMEERTDMYTFLGAATAKWSLASNARRHPIVESTIEAALETATGADRQHYNDMLNKPPQEIQAEYLAILEEQHELGNW
jgi:tetratricopeptide (TPR) repeat protein